MAGYIDKCECFIHSLKKDGHGVLAEATILKKIGDNDYLAEYNGVKCHALFNPFVTISLPYPHLSFFECR